MATTTLSELIREVTPEGTFYIYNGKRAGPFTSEQEALAEFDMKVLPDALGVDSNTLLIFRVNQAVTEWTLQFEEKNMPAHLVAEQPCGLRSAMCRSSVHG